MTNSRSKPLYDVCACIITYNRIDYTKNCLDTFIATAPARWSIVIVDNGSTDGTKEYLLKRFKHQRNVRIILSDRNLYPAGGNQLALAKAFPASSYLLCDNDGLFTDKSWWPTAYKVLAQPKVALVNLRASRWRETKKLGNNIQTFNGIRCYVTTHVASFSLINHVARRLLVRRLSGKWIGKRIGEIVQSCGMKSVALYDGLIYDQSENDLNNPKYREQYEKFWTEKRRLHTFKKIVAQLDQEQNQQMTNYKHPQRLKGSQSEIPTININKGIIVVNGYQKYTIDNKSVTAHSKSNKYQKVLDWLIQISPKSYVDVGCSNGVLPFMAASEGIRNITALDHDSDCIHVIKKASELSGLSVSPSKYSFGEPVEKHSITSALAIIHWLWSCTAKYESFDAILAELCSFTTDYLIIEWIEPTDRAILKFKHLDFGSNKSAYTKENFLLALSSIGTILEYHAWNATRTVYLVRLNSQRTVIPVRSNKNFTSDIIISGGNVTKTISLPKLLNFSNDQLSQLRKELYHREIHWLKVFESQPWSPKLISCNPNDLSITMTYCGERLTDDNAPDNLYQQLFTISQHLAKQKCHYADWKLENLTVLNGRVHLIDFGWSFGIITDPSINNTVPSILKSKPGGEQWLH
jgi:hypothetical protein